jgi:hypothetical protein
MFFINKALLVTLLLIIEVANVNGQNRPDTATNSRTLLLPEFYHAPYTKGDTTYSYELYSGIDRRARLDTLTSIDCIEHIYFVKSYYLDGARSNISAPYFTKKVVVYTKIGNEVWAAKNMITSEYAQLNEQKDMITRTDTLTLEEPGSGKKRLLYVKYYKVTEQQNAREPEHKHTHEHGK